MRRRELVGSIVAAGLAARPASAQGKAFRIGLLVTGSGPHPIEQELPRALAALGYRIGTDFSIDARYADRQSDRAAALASELVAAKVDVIVTHFTPATRAAKQATATIPIVMAPVGAPVEAGLVASLARPGGNVTGITNLGAEIGGRRLQVLRDLIPSLKTVAVLASSEDPFARVLVADLQQAAPDAGVAIAPHYYGPFRTLESAFEAIGKGSVQAIVLQGGGTGALRTQALRMAADRGLPVMTSDADSVREGALVCVIGSEAEIYRRAASFVDRIRRGAKPQDLPVEQPTSTVLTINRTVARRLGLPIPLHLQAAADELID